MATENYRVQLYAQYGKHFQDVGDTFDQGASLRWGKPYRHYLFGWLPKSREAEIVELACGSGRLLYFLKQAGYTRIIGVDISPDQVAVSKQVTPNIIQCEILDFLENQTSRFDLIVGLDIVEHFHKPEVLRFLNLCFGALKPGGRVLLQTPNAESPWCSTHRYNDLTHEVCFNPNALSRLLRCAGFSEIECRETGPVPFSYSLLSSTRYLIWALIRLGLKAWNLAETGHAGSGIFTRVFLISGIKS